MNEHIRRQESTVMAGLNSETVNIQSSSTNVLQPIRQLRLAHNLDPPLSDRQIDLSKIPDGVLDTSHLGVLMVALKKVVYRWKDLGDQLSVDYYKQNEIEEDNRGIGRKCIREMLAAWLKGGEYNKQALKTALQNMDYQIIFESHVCTPDVRASYMLYAFLHTKLACQLQDIASSLAADEGSPIPLEVPRLSELLEDLGDKDLIVYLKNEQYVERSWVVVKREAILKDVNGVLFAPKYFQGYHLIASNTGIIRASSLHKLFPQYDAEMLVELMKRLEFCKPVNLSGINTNLQPLDSTSIEDCPLFFPSLLHAGRPRFPTSEDEQPCSQQLSFGWCLGCTDYEYQFLTERFLHVLLLRLAYTFPLPCKHYLKTHSLHGFERRCTVWTNGIAWNNNNGVRTVVEVIQQSRWVVVTMFRNKDTRPVEYSRHRSAVIRLVLDLQQELAPDLDTFECLISPSLLQQWPLDHLPETDLFSIEDVATSVLCRKPLILSYKDDSHQLATSAAVYFEPYHLLSPSSVCELMDSSKNEQPVSPALLSEVKKCCQLSQLESPNYLSLREHLDKMSIFAGRNPLVVAELDPETVISTSLSSSPVTAPAQQPVEQLSSAGGHSSQAHSKQAPAVNTVDLSDIPDGTLNIDSHLRLLMVALTDIAYQWEHLGIQLGLSYSRLQVIERNRRGKQMDCMQDMLAAWLKGSEEACSKQALITALQNIRCFQ